MRQTGHDPALRRIATVPALLLLAALLLAVPAAAMKDPGAVYCEALGYQYVAVTTASGGEIGQCRISATEQVDAWKFLQGGVSQDRSYCARQGLGYRQVNDPAACKAFGLDTCMVCVTAGGQAVEVTRLMNLSFEEGVCGDGTCAMSENTARCAQDCPPGGSDGYCDGAKDGKCDPDCPAGGDPDCGAPSTTRSPAGPSALLAAAAGAALVFVKKHRG